MNTEGSGNKRILRLVTSNEGKVLEMRQHLSRLGYGVEQADIGYPELQAETLDEVVRYGLEALRERGEAGSWCCPLIVWSPLYSIRSDSCCPGRARAHG